MTVLSLIFLTDSRFRYSKLLKLANSDESLSNSHPLRSSFISVDLRVIVSIIELLR